MPRAIDFAVDRVTWALLCALSRSPAARAFVVAGSSVHVLGSPAEEDAADDSYQRVHLQRGTQGNPPSPI